MKPQLITHDMLLSYMMDYEAGTITWNDTLSLFAFMIREGLMHMFQGSYGRFAHGLIVDGWVNTEGEILKWSEDE